MNDESCYWCSTSSLAAVAASSDNDAELDSDQLGAEFWKTKYHQLEEHCKVINEQKVTAVLVEIQVWQRVI